MGVSSCRGQGGLLFFVRAFGGFLFPICKPHKIEIDNFTFPKMYAGKKSMVIDVKLEDIFNSAYFSHQK